LANDPLAPPIRKRHHPHADTWAAALVASPAIADRNVEHDSARRAVELGQALPLVDVLARVRRDLGGEILGVSFER
jgi:hypothetical protein